MNPWLERAVVSVAASVVSTTVWVTTAKQPAAKKRRRKKKKGARRRGSDGLRTEEAVPRSPGAQAAHDYRAGHDGGLTGREFLENVKGLGRSTAKRARFVGGLIGLGSERAVSEKPTTEARRAKVEAEGPPVDKPLRKADARHHPDAQRERRPRRDDALGALQEEVVRRARRAATDKVVQEATERAGMASAVERLKDTSEGLKSTGEKLGKAIKGAVPEGFSGSLNEAGRNVKTTAERAGRSVKGAFEDAFEDDEGLGKRLDRGVKDFGRWIQGPGAPRSELARTRPARRVGVVEATDADDIVEAKDADDVVEAKDADDVVEAKDADDVVEAKMDVAPKAEDGAKGGAAARVDEAPKGPSEQGEAPPT